tara:strand:+ start:2024 stop:4828 length:2805 start_codon:yes stop_codon:yes gene_type:complete
MSTQLILYPQSYNGIYSFNSENEFMVDGIYFSSIDGSTSSSTATTIDNHLYATPPSIINTWYRWRSTDTGTPALPVETSGNLVLNAVAPSSISGVYQKLSNLTVGASYTLTVNMTPVAGIVVLKAFNLNTNSLISSQLLSSNTTQQTIPFVAQNTNDTVTVLYYNTGATDLTISSISVTPTGTSPSQIYTDLLDGQVICDLYQEEDIPLTLSIDDFKNVAEKVQSYSKDFNLPATKRNNRIFNNMFDVTRSDDGIIFNPYVKTQCVLKQDGFILFEGYLRLINVKDKNGEISYNVNLYSEVIALADVLKDSTFSDLDFTELEHTYNKNTIKDSWESVGAGNGLPLTYALSTSSFAYDAVTGTGHTQVLKYPFIDWNHQYLVGGTGGNPSATTGRPELAFLEQVFRPCIQLKYLINKIFAATNEFTYTSSFFDSADFEKLFMDFNWGADNQPILIDEQGAGYVDATQTATTSYVTVQTNDNNYTDIIGYSAGVYTATQDNQIFNITYSHGFLVNSGAGAWTVTFRWKWVHASDGSIDYIDVNPITGVGPTTAFNYGVPNSGSFSRNLMTGDTLSPEFKSVDASTHDIEIQILGAALFGNAYETAIHTTSDPVTNESILGTLRGELGQWDFLKGIMTMFNLVTMVDENNPNNILIETYSDIFINNTRSNDVSDMTLSSRFDGKVHDWTDKIDVSEMELKPLTELNKNTIFQFVEDEDDYIFRQFKNAQSGHLYGSKEIDASGFTILEGTEEIVAEPFAATVSKPLMSQFPNFITPAIYAMGDEGTTEGFDNSPRIFYNNGIKPTGTSYYIPPQNDKPGENQSQFLQFSHLSAIPSVVSSPPTATDTRDFVFESAQLLSALGSPPTNNLYSTYWQPYFNELYNADTRTMKLKVNLSPSDVASFKFYDVVMVKNRAFRVNKIEYKPNTLAKVEFILIP